MAEMHEKRLEICRSCEHFKPVFKHMVDVCSVCLCVMQAKTRMRSAECPKGHWGKE